MLLLFHGQTYNFMLFLHLASFHVSWRRLSPTMSQVSWSSPNGQPNVVSSSVEPTQPTPSADCSTQGSTSNSASTSHGLPTLQEALPPGSSFIGEALSGFGLPLTTATLIKESWRHGTRVQYDSLLRGWTRFCASRQVHPMSPTTYDILAYLTSMFERGLAYRTISAAKSVLSGRFHIPFPGSLQSLNIIPSLFACQKGYFMFVLHDHVISFGILTWFSLI